MAAKNYADIDDHELIAKLFKVVIIFAHPNAAKLLIGWLGREGQKIFDEATDRGIPLEGYDTRGGRMVKGKRLSLFTSEWTDRESELEGKCLKAMGRE